MFSYKIIIEFKVFNNFSTLELINLIKKVFKDEYVIFPEIEVIKLED